VVSRLAPLETADLAGVDRTRWLALHTRTNLFRYTGEFRSGQRHGGKPVAGRTAARASNPNFQVATVNVFGVGSTLPERGAR
jgi:hypothetical protein